MASPSPALLSPPRHSTSLANIFDSPSPAKPTHRSVNPLFFNDVSPSVSPSLSTASHQSRFILPQGALATRDESARNLASTFSLFDDLDDDDDAGRGAGVGAAAGGGDDAGDALARGQSEDNAGDGAGGVWNNTTKRIIPKLDAQRLLAHNGLPKLIKESKEIKFKGKGHEVADLACLLGYYQLWTHQLFPKTRFKDTVAQVEKVCRSRRMLSALSEFRAKEMAPPLPPPSPPRSLVGSPIHRSSRSRSPPGSPSSTRRPAQRRRLLPGDEETGDVPRAAAIPASSHDLSEPDFDMDELIAQAEIEAQTEAARRATTETSTAWSSAAASAGGKDNDMFGDDEDWSILDGLDGGATASKPPPPPPPPAPAALAPSHPVDDDDEDDWAAMDGM